MELQFRMRAAGENFLTECNTISAERQRKSRNKRVLLVLAIVLLVLGLRLLPATSLVKFSYRFLDAWSSRLQGGQADGLRGIIPRVARELGRDGLSSHAQTERAGSRFRRAQVVVHTLWDVYDNAFSALRKTEARGISGLFRTSAGH